MEILTWTEKAVLLLIKASQKGSFKKTEEGYSFELGEEGKCIVDITSKGIDFKVRTIKWVPGNYEPIEGSELYTQVKYDDLDDLNDEEKLNKITSMVSSI